MSQFHSPSQYRRFTGSGAPARSAHDDREARHRQRGYALWAALSRPEAQRSSGSRLKLRQDLSQELAPAARWPLDTASPFERTRKFEPGLSKKFVRRARGNHRVSASLRGYEIGRGLVGRPARAQPAQRFWARYKAFRPFSSHRIQLWTHNGPCGG
jgi:hypothetical protein